MHKVSRRDFFKQSSAAAAGMALPYKIPGIGKKDEDQKVKKYKTLGKTGWKVGDISAGAGQRDPSFVQYEVDCGINYFDSAYAYGNHEDILGQALKKLPRDKVFIATKWDYRFDNATATKKKLLDEIDKQLKRLNTSYIDCMMIHAIGQPGIGDIKRVQNPEIREAWDEAKKQGKIRFTGASGCGVNLLEEANWAIDNDLFDIILTGGNFLTHGLEDLLKKARSKGVGTVAMKIMTTIRFDLDINPRSLIDEKTNVRQALIKYMLAKDLFDTIVISMRNYNQVREYLAVSGTTELAYNEKKTLDQLAVEISSSYCRPGCNLCSGKCEYNVPIADILRYKMYFENYREEKRALQFFSQIPKDRTPERCKNCSAPCEKACKYKIPIREKLLEAHDFLTLA